MRWRADQLPRAAAQAIGALGSSALVECVAVVFRILALQRGSRLKLGIHLVSFCPSQLAALDAQARVGGVKGRRPPLGLLVAFVRRTNKLTVAAVKNAPPTIVELLGDEALTANGHSCYLDLLLKIAPEVSRLAAIPAGPPGPNEWR